MILEITECANGWMVRDAPDMTRDMARDPKQYMVFQTMAALLGYIESRFAPKVGDNAGRRA